PAGRIFRPREYCAEHDCVGAGSDRLAEVARLLNAAIGDYRDIAAGLTEEVVAGGGAFNRRADLRDPNAKHFTAGADCTRTNPDQDPGDAGLHELSSRAVADGVTNDDGDGQLTAELLESEALETPRHVPRGGDCRLDKKDI